MNKKKQDRNGIYIYGAREHNLKSINTFIPRNKITIVTGLSGSGKSSLVFDTIYAEGQRRYVESLSSYARFFIDQMKKPELDSITGLSPAIAIDQRSINTSPRSTVGTVTETYDYLRLLFSKLGTPYCIQHQKPLVKSSLNQITKEIMSLPKESRFFVLAPVAQGKKGTFVMEFERFLSAGYTRARVDGQWIELASAEKLSQRKDHFIDLLIDRLTVTPTLIPRLKESLQKSIDLTEGQIKIEVIGKKPKHYSIHATCPVCQTGAPPQEPKMFSFNNPKGACPQCKGLGYRIDTSDFYETSEFDTTPYENLELSEEETGDTPPCPACAGTRLNPFALNVKIKGKNIADLSALSIEQLSKFCVGLTFPKEDKMIADKILEKIKRDLEFLKKMGVGYLSLSRSIRTLSGGEAQRIRLMSQISSPLIGVLYVLDEPSIGLHPKDHNRLLNILFRIRDRGNTVLMVEHDEKTIRSAEHIIDLGPRAGTEGGRIVAEGSLKEVIKSPRSLTGSYLSGQKKIPIPTKRKKANGKALEIKGAMGHNLKKINVKIPLSLLVGVTGVSGSGKSTLIIDTLYKALLKNLNKAVSSEPCPYKTIKGLNFLDKVTAVNQKPIGRTPRSVPATYVGVMSAIRSLMALIPSARARGYTPGDFSFNIKGGRCENCSGKGQIKQEMLFLPSAVLPCDICQGQRYSDEILNILYKGKNIYEILNMDITSALKFFAHHPLIQNQLKLLEEVGLGYLTLGQSSVTLSGGEAQRIKLTKELAKKNTERTLYILDEPTTGLHFQDIEKLILVLKKLTDKGATVIVIEHQMDVIKSCDYVIDLGPGGGSEGGHIIAQGPPEQIIKSARSTTAPFLRPVL